MNRWGGTWVAGRPAVGSVPALLLETGDFLVAQELAAIELVGSLERRQGAVVPDALQVRGAPLGAGWCPGCCRGRTLLSDGRCLCHTRKQQGHAQCADVSGLHATLQ